MINRRAWSSFPADYGEEADDERGGLMWRDLDGGPYVCPGTLVHKASNTTRASNYSLYGGYTARGGKALHLHS